VRCDERKYFVDLGKFCCLIITSVWVDVELYVQLVTFTSKYSLVVVCYWKSYIIMKTKMSHHRKI